MLANWDNAGVNMGGKFTCSRESFGKTGAGVAILRGNLGLCLAETDS